MKTLALTIAATLIASSSGFAGGLFDVNDAPATYEIQNSAFDTEATASVGFNAPAAIGNYAPRANNGLFDVTDQVESAFDLEPTASIGNSAPVAISGNYAPQNNNSLFDVSDR